MLQAYNKGDKAPTVAIVVMIIGYKLKCLNVDNVQSIRKKQEEFGTIPAFGLWFDVLDESTVQVHLPKKDLLALKREDGKIRINDVVTFIWELTNVCFDHDFDEWFKTLTGQPEEVRESAFTSFSF